MLQGLLYNPFLAPKRICEATGDDHKQRIEHAPRALLFNKQLCTVASLNMTVKGALLKVRFAHDDILQVDRLQDKYQSAVKRAKKRLVVASEPSSAVGFLLVLVNVTLPECSVCHYRQEEVGFVLF